MSIPPPPYQMNLSPVLFLLQVLVLLNVWHASSKAIATLARLFANSRAAEVEVKSSPRLLRRAPPIVKATNPSSAGSRASSPLDPSQPPLNPIAREAGLIVPPATRGRTPSLFVYPCRPTHGRNSPSTAQPSGAESLHRRSETDPAFLLP